jgi:beta-lactamase regulating signal transducer with metallopeptidase domain
MEAIAEHINSAGKAFVDFSLPMLIQACLLIIFIFGIDLILRRKVRSIFRYCLWLLILAKLVIPPSFSTPSGVGNLFGDKLTEFKIEKTEVAAEPKAAAVNTGVSLYPTLQYNIEPRQMERPFYQRPQASENFAQTQPQIQAAPAVSITWQGAVFIIWLAVVFAMLMLVIQRAIFVRSLVKQAELITGGLNDTLQNCCNLLGVKGKIILRQSANATSPAVCGLFTPVILIPRGLLSRLTREQIKTVCIHELVHIKRGDLWVNLIQTLLQIVYFYNPLLWFANAMICRIREQAVDEAVLVALGKDAEIYPRILLDVAKLSFKRPALSLRLIGVVESKSALKTRIARMISRPIPKKAKLGILGLLIIIITGSILLPMAADKKILKGIDEKLNVSDKAREITINSLYMEPPNGKNLMGNSVTLSIGVTNNSQKEVYLGLEYYADSGTVAKVFSPGASSLAQIQKIDPNWQGTIEFPIYHPLFVKGGYINVTLAKCFDLKVNQFLPPEAEVLYEKKYFVCVDEEPQFVIKGTVTNVNTGEPIAGAKVFDDRYGPGADWNNIKSGEQFKFGAITDSNGQYSYITWYEEHGLKCDANSYNSQRTVLMTKIFGSEKEKIINFSLKSEKEQSTASLKSAKWETASEVEGADVANSPCGIGTPYGEFAFSKMYESDDITSIIVTHSLSDKLDYRLIAIDKNGQSHNAGRIQTIGSENNKQSTISFKASKDDIVKFLIQIRGKEQISPKNDLLSPGQKTDVQIEAEKSAGQGGREESSAQSSTSINPVSVQIVPDSTVEEGKKDIYKWNIKPPDGFTIDHGWFSLIDNEMKESVGGGRDDADDNRLAGLALTTETQDGFLVLNMQRIYEPQDEADKTAIIKSRTSIPQNCELKVANLSRYRRMTNEEYFTLWEGNFVRDGKVVKTVVYCARLSPLNDDIKNFSPKPSGINALGGPGIPRTRVLIDRDKSEPQAKNEGEKVIKAEKLVWGPEILGLRAAVELVPEKQSYSLGDSLQIRFHIQNVSSQTIQFSSVPGWYIQLFLEDSHGKVMPGIVTNYLGWEALRGKNLTPKETVDLESLTLSIFKGSVEADAKTFITSNSVILKPGHYKLYYEFSIQNFRLIDEQGNIISGPLSGWTGKLITGKLDFTVTSQSPNNPTGRIMQATITDRPPTFLDLDTGEISQDANWPERFDIGWDNDGGGAIMCRRAGLVRMAPFNRVQIRDLNEAITIAPKRIHQLDVGLYGMFAKESKYFLILTSKQNIAVAEIVNYDPDKATLRWKITDLKLPLKSGLVYHGLDLTGIPFSTLPQQLPDLWEERPPGSKSYEMRKDVNAIFQDIDRKSVV